MSIAIDALSWLLLLTGGFFVLVGGVGALRMPEFYTRMHAASLTDSMGSILILAGMMLQAGLSLATVKLGTILIFLMLTGPTATYALANSAFVSGVRPKAADPETDTTRDQA